MKNSDLGIIVTFIKNTFFKPPLLLLGYAAILQNASFPWKWKSAVPIHGRKVDSAPNLLRTYLAKVGTAHFSTYSNLPLPFLVREIRPPHLAQVTFRFCRANRKHRERVLSILKINGLPRIQNKLKTVPTNGAMICERGLRYRHIGGPSFLRKKSWCRFWECAFTPSIRT